MDKADTERGLRSISVVVILLKGGASLERCLEALSRQEGVGTVEIIVPYDDTHADIVLLRDAFPNVRMIYVAGEHTFAELRAVGVRAAGGDVIALTEDHCVPRTEWCREVLAAHDGPVAAAGGAVEKLAPDTALNWALYLADYVRYANPHPAGPVRHLTDCNVTYKRSALEPIASVWEHEFHEPEVHAALEAAGGVLWYAPGIVLEQQRSITFGDAVRDRYAFGRLFGGRRAQTVSPMKRIVFAVSAVLLPAVLTLRVFQHVVRTRRYRGGFLRALPLVVLLNAVWAFGEFLGYLTGRVGVALTPDAQGVRSQEHLQTAAQTP